MKQLSILLLAYLSKFFSAEENLKNLEQIILICYNCYIPLAPLFYDILEKDSCQKYYYFLLLCT